MAVAAPTLDALEERLLALERRDLEVPHPVALSANEAAQLRRSHAAVAAGGCYSARWKWVPSSYYGYDLEKRRRTLGASTKLQLCKSMLMENKAWSGKPGEELSDRTNSRYYLIVVQYEATISVKKLMTELRALRPAGPGGERLDASSFDFRVASAEDNYRLTGFVHNSVTPFGLLERVPIVLAAGIAKMSPRFMWMGGGHVDLKLGMSVREFAKATGALVLDASEPRSSSAAIEEE